jgi:hypothetical protein
MDNSRRSRIFNHKETRHNLWVEYASFGALYLCAMNNIDSIAWPTGDQALEEEQNKPHAGLYWEDHRTIEGKTKRLFLPNYFNTFSEMLTSDLTYSNFIGNRGTVLELVGRHSEAQKHFEEAEDFSPMH